MSEARVLVPGSSKVTVDTRVSMEVTPCVLSSVNVAMVVIVETGKYVRHHPSYTVERKDSGQNLSGKQ